VLGAGGTASAAAVALADLGLGAIRLVVREPARATQTAEAAKAAGLEVTVLRWSEVDWRAEGVAAAAVVSTVPAGAVEPHAAELARSPVLLDVVYHPWPTPLAERALARGGRLATGLDMLLHHAFGQVEQFTGRPAPREAMRDALAAAVDDTTPLRL
jgi:shikimate dehydrogenase